MTMQAGQSFFPGHEDIDKVHVASPDAAYCTKCKMDLRGRGDLRIAADDAEEYKVLRRKNQLTDRIKKETNQMTQQNLLRALKQLYPGATQQVEERLERILTVDEAHEGRMQGYGQAQTGSGIQGISQQYGGQGSHKPQSGLDAMRTKLAADLAMNQGIDQKMGALTPGQRQTARQNAEKALAIALFHTEPRLHSHLLLNPANDESDVMDAAMAKAWRDDLNQWRTQAIERAGRMVAIMDGLGKASL